MMLKSEIHVLCTKRENLTLWCNSRRRQVMNLLFSAGKYINHVTIKGLAQAKAAAFKSEHFIR